MRMSRARTVGLAVIGLRVGTAFPATGQTVDVFPTQSGSKRQDTHWPEGWVARFAPSLEIVHTRGRVRYRDGDVCRLSSGSGG